MKPQCVDIRYCTVLRNDVAIIAGRPCLSNRRVTGWGSHRAPFDTVHKACYDIVRCVIYDSHKFPQFL